MSFLHFQSLIVHASSSQGSIWSRKGKEIKGDEVEEEKKEQNKNKDC